MSNVQLDAFGNIITNMNSPKWKRSVTLDAFGNPIEMEDESTPKFIRLANLRKHKIEGNNYLNSECIAYYSLDFYGWNKPNNPDFINILKNDFNKTDGEELLMCCDTLLSVAQPHIESIIKQENIDAICIVPRAKIKSHYKIGQLFFINSIKHIITKIKEEKMKIEDGSDYILRTINTKTTHFHTKREYGGDGDLPYPSITKKTCDISSLVKGKSILLIDDVYTKSINIDEDCIQALIDNGAKRVVLYTIAKTVSEFSKVSNYNNSAKSSNVNDDFSDIPF